MGKKKAVKTAKKPSTPIKKTSMTKAALPSVIKPTAAPQKASPMVKLSTAQKVGIGVAAAVGVAGTAYAAKKIFSGKRKRNQTQKLKAKLIRKMLKIKNIQLDRKLLKEQMRGI